MIRKRTWAENRNFLYRVDITKNKIINIKMCNVTYWVLRFYTLFLFRIHIFIHYVYITYTLGKVNIMTLTLLHDMQSINKIVMPPFYLSS